MFNKMISIRIETMENDNKCVKNENVIISNLYTDNKCNIRNNKIRKLFSEFETLQIKLNDELTKIE